MSSEYHPISKGASLRHKDKELVCVHHVLYLSVSTEINVNRHGSSGMENLIHQPSAYVLMAGGQLMWQHLPLAHAGSVDCLTNPTP